MCRKRRRRRPSTSGETCGAHRQVQCGQRAEEVNAGNIFYDCFKGESEETLGTAQVEARARELRKAKNFSLGMCEDLMRQCCPLGAGKPCRHAHLKEDARVEGDCGRLCPRRLLLRGWHNV